MLAEQLLLPRAMVISASDELKVCGVTDTRQGKDSYIVEELGEMIITIRPASPANLTQPRGLGH